MIETSRLRLHPCTGPCFDAILADDDAALGGLLGVAVAPDWNTFADGRAAMPFAAAFLRAHPEAADWWFYLLVDKATNTLVGTGGFKGLPTAAGEVEIGYSVAPSCQGHGLATEAARGLVAFAWSNPAVHHVLAHTRPHLNPSTQVLQKAGFVHQHTVVDPDDGPVWQWCLARPAA